MLPRIRLNLAPDSSWRGAHFEISALGQLVSRLLQQNGLFDIGFVEYSGNARLSASDFRQNQAMRKILLSLSRAFVVPNSSDVQYAQAQIKDDGETAFSEEAAVGMSLLAGF